MPDPSVTVAAVTIVPGVITGLATLWLVAKGNRVGRSIDRAVNHQPPGEATLVEKVDCLRGTAEQLDGKVDRLDYKVDGLGRRVGAVERKVG